MSDIIVDYDPYFTPVCNKCIHFILGTFSCRAFDRIPDIILTGKNNHHKPLPDQINDLVFTPKP